MLPCRRPQTAIFRFASKKANPGQTRHVYGAVEARHESEERYGSRPKFEYESFENRHIGPRLNEQKMMLSVLGYASMEDFISNVLPSDLQKYTNGSSMSLPDASTESSFLRLAQGYSAMNKVRKSYIGMGYYGTITPPVIQRNILENPAWYTQYTPYQAEISQGRLEGLLNFQTMISELTGLPVANASLLDESSAAAEAMYMLWRAETGKTTFLVDHLVFPQTISCLRTHAEPLGIQIRIVDSGAVEDYSDAFGMILQYPDVLGQVSNLRPIIKNTKENGVRVAICADILSLVFLKAPGQIDADVAVGTTQRFGVPMGYGGPHAAYFACAGDLRRRLPGRVVGISKDMNGNPALRLALQTREQHIRRDKATSNICTAQALLANMAQLYAIYHGPKGLKRVAWRVHQQAIHIANVVQKLGHKLMNKRFFDTITIQLRDQLSAKEMCELALKYNVLLRQLGDRIVSISLDESVDDKDMNDLVSILAMEPPSLADETPISIDGPCDGFIGLSPELLRNDLFMPQPVFNSYHSETEMLRYIYELQSRDMSLAQSMIPLGSCTMKLNPTSAMMPLSYPGISGLHPFAPLEDAQGYQLILDELCSYLCTITGLKAFTLMPNSGAQGEFTGLCVIRKYHQRRGDKRRNICFIPISAHGTNPASATLAGFSVVSIKCDSHGNIDRLDFEQKLKTYGDQLACMMVTYPSTYGIFDDGIEEICRLVRNAGGLIYMDGANMNAQLGYLKPAELGVHVAHLNLHKTFCIPHGGGGPGMGPVGVVEELVDYLPSHPVLSSNGKEGAMGPIAATPYGSASISVIPWAYLKMMGEEGLRKCSQIALLNANYLMKRLEQHYRVLFRNRHDLCAHEFIIDCRPFKDTADIDVVDIAKRLLDYSIHSPTMNWPVPGTLMIEPTESESLSEMERFVEAMISIREEIRLIETDEWPRGNNPLKNAPHPVQVVIQSKWDHPYSREQAVLPVNGLRKRKFWPTVSRLDDVYGDQNFACTVCS